MFWQCDEREFNAYAKSYRNKIDFEAWNYGLYSNKASFIAIADATGVNNKGLTYPERPYSMEEKNIKFNHNEIKHTKSDIELDKEYRKSLIATQIF